MNLFPCALELCDWTQSSFRVEGNLCGFVDCLEFPNDFRRKLEKIENLRDPCPRQFHPSREV